MTRAWERDEWWTALRVDRVKPGDCFRHDMRPDGKGRGVCSFCGLTVTGEEIA